VVPHVNVLAPLVVHHVVRKLAAALVVVVNDHRLQHLLKLRKKGHHIQPSLSRIRERAIYSDSQEENATVC
jgi:hypothetical protein